MLLALPALAFAATGGEKAVVGIGERMNAKDCAGAVERLNAGLRAGYPEVALLAGNLFETGSCVRQDWDKSVGYYTQAFEGGVREGAYRLAAGFAALAHGPDTAAALWWARKAGLPVERCIGRLPKTEDPDRFVEELGKWSGQELATCNYIVGQLSFMYADVRYPLDGVRDEAVGRAVLEYVPSQSHFEVSVNDGTRTGVQNVLAILAHAQWQAGRLYARPAAFDADWKLVFVLPVDVNKGRWWSREPSGRK